VLVNRLAHALVDCLKSLECVSSTPNLFLDIIASSAGFLFPVWDVEFTTVVSHEVRHTSLKSDGYEGVEGRVLGRARTYESLGELARTPEVFVKDLSGNTYHSVEVVLALVIVLNPARLHEFFLREGADSRLRYDVTCYCF
jgi:hypothetical protein